VKFYLNLWLCPFNLGYNFWLVSARVFIFLMCIPSGRIFHLIPWPWPSDLWVLNLSQSSSLRLCSCQRFKVSFIYSLLVRQFLFLSKIRRIGISLKCQTDTLPSCFCRILFNKIYMNWQMRVFSIVTQKIADILPGFNHLLNMNELLERLLCLIVYHTYCFRKNMKSIDDFFPPTNSWDSKRKNSKRYVTNRYVTSCFL
jgi:hypothetical protein